MCKSRVWKNGKRFCFFDFPLWAFSWTSSMDRDLENLEIQHLLFLFTKWKSIYIFRQCMTLKEKIDHMFVFPCEVGVNSWVLLGVIFSWAILEIATNMWGFCHATDMHGKKGQNKTLVTQRDVFVQLNRNLKLFSEDKIVFMQKSNSFRSLCSETIVWWPLIYTLAFLVTIVAADVCILKSTKPAL